jgi:hypothetical protein
MWVGGWIAGAFRPLIKPLEFRWVRNQECELYRELTRSHLDLYKPASNGRSGLTRPLYN